MPCETLGQKYTAVLAAISEGKGFYSFALYDEAVNEEKFIKFLTKLHELNKGKSLAIVMDNLPAHKTIAVRDKMRELGITWIFNVPYSPEYNAIEMPFS